MLSAKRLPNGNLLVPRRAESENGDLVGVGWVEITPEDPSFDRWIKDMEREAEFQAWLATQKK